jgi:cardiolipin synthase C
MLNVCKKIKSSLLFLLGLMMVSPAQANVTGSIIVSNDPHQVVLLNESAPALKKRIDMIRNAKSTIEMEVWLFDLSRSARLILRELIAKKQADPSIQIRIIVDYYVTGGLAPITPVVAQSLAKLGIQVKYYNQVPKEDLVELDHRDHSKLFMVDGSEFIVGSRNMSDDHFGMRPDLDYIDSDFWVSGPIARQVQEGFYEFWNSPIVKEPEGTFGNSKPEQVTAIDDQDKLVAQNAETLGSEALANSKVYTVNQVTFVKDGPLNLDNERKVTDYVNTNLSKVGNNLLVENWSFIPDAFRLAILNKLMKDGVKIQLLTNGFDSYISGILAGMGWVQEKKEIPKGLTTSYYDSPLVEPQLDPAGPGKNCVYETHSKTAIRDMVYVDVGSYNWDGRSAYINHEDLFTVYSPDIAKDMAAVIQTRIRRSVKVNANGDAQNGKSVLPSDLQGAQKWLHDAALSAGQEYIGQEF